MSHFYRLLTVSIALILTVLHTVCTIYTFMTLPVKHGHSYVHLYNERFIWPQYLHEGTATEIITYDAAADQPPSRLLAHGSRICDQKQIEGDIQGDQHNPVTPLRFLGNGKIFPPYAVIAKYKRKQQTSRQLLRISHFVLIYNGTNRAHNFRGTEGVRPLR